MNVNKLAKKYDKLKDKALMHSFIYISDDGCVDIEYCRKVIKFEKEQIVLELAGSDVKIIGLELSMRNYGYKNVKIYGKIHSIQFEENSKGEYHSENE